MNGTDDNLIRDLPVISENGIDLDYDVSMHQIFMLFLEKLSTVGYIK